MALQTNRDEDSSLGEISARRQQDPTNERHCGQSAAFADTTSATFKNLYRPGSAPASATSLSLSEHTACASGPSDSTNPAKTAAGSLKQSPSNAQTDERRMLFQKKMRLWGRVVQEYARDKVAEELIDTMTATMAKWCIDVAVLRSDLFTHGINQLRSTTSNAKFQF